ncbi:Hypothetical protein PP7435_CHR4-1400 [Komagataella phaffii CBS 7435]|uniref:Endonuclease/exonuclease/phosphatase domain-containing protein n=1 Tax=Komagataella phaffii (strain ATCC 76273 / CBS 7435 / CECT 11047 / NRRL Y-11430 / Wegner 21-1) TaxID=981350 RepID=A0A1G4KQT5_KOMPC|nr:GQ67_04856T0 [Komagataella phaffii]AOA69746.1 GQ68_04828T0 [Komagataella phaffii GS115]CAH2450863.1 Hypothetical protein BQ9382_C4-2530 [Komagataella phaffii CBS 7435]SCV12374.1 Hypothetical protein PP7435_CHR4-1400 [Komagataella phaffii CBS 7435]
MRLRPSIVRPVRLLYGSRNFNTVTKHRRWIDVQKPNSYGDTFSVSTYNILNQHYIWPQVFKYVPENDIDWNYRQQLLDKNFRDLNTDIMCFQEMEYDIYDTHWKNSGESSPLKDYRSIFVRKKPPHYWTKSERNLDGVSIFYKDSVFEVIDHVDFDLADLVREHDFPSFEHTEDFKERVLPRNTVALVAALRHKHSGEIVMVSTTHLYWSPKFQDVKLIQMLIICNVIRQFQKKLEKKGLLSPKDPIPLIICGDLNSQIDSFVYQFLKTGDIDLHRDYEKWFTKYDYGSTLDLLKSSDPLKLKSSYNGLFQAGNFPFTTFTEKYTNIIDYVWYNKEKFDLIRELGQVDPSYVASQVGFPNDEFPSDHIPLVNIFQFK